jgi:hypothetical protein
MQALPGVEKDRICQNVPERYLDDHIEDL